MQDHMHSDEERARRSKLEALRDQGIGPYVDRFVSLLTNCENLRDVVLFPLLRPE